MLRCSNTGNHSALKCDGDSRTNGSDGYSTHYCECCSSNSFDSHGLPRQYSHIQLVQSGDLEGLGKEGGDNADDEIDDSAGCDDLANHSGGVGSLAFSSVIPMHEFGYFSVFGILYAMIFSLLAVLALIKVLPTTRFVIAT